MRILGLVLATFVGLSPMVVTAQDAQTLADIRQELTILHVEMQKLRRELSTTGTSNLILGGSSVLERVGSIETQLQRLTARTEQMDHRIDQIVTDGTNRIGDLEFRLVELEGGDISALGETTTLGGGAAAPVGDANIAPPDSGETVDSGEQMAIGEEADFQQASKALADGAYKKAADLFTEFESAYPGSPLAAEANLSRGKALDGLGDTREAARAYLASFTSDATGPVAPDSLFQLGVALGRLGQTDQACVTLGEVGARFPGALAASDARKEMTRLGCS
ncbi:MAG: tol-pal system protein YbgF [Rhodobacteraceae bacterium]|nr:tol-pal system protein YbgF [Paracoccaceae bacterium]